MAVHSQASALIDVHAHFLTDRYVNAARAAGITQPDGMPMWPSWSVGDHLQLMHDNRIVSAILSISSPGVHFGDDSAAADLARHVNEFAAGVVAEHKDRFAFFASLPLPCVEAAVDEAAHAMDALGALGVVLMSNSAGTYLGDIRLDPLWEALDRRRAIVFVHPTSPPNVGAVALDRPSPMLEFMFETTRSVTDLIFAGVQERYPEIRFVIPHCGATLPVVVDRVELFRSLLPGSNDRPRAALTTRQQLQRFWYDLAGTPFPAPAKALVDVVGSAQLLYGSDFCWTPAMGACHHVTLMDQEATDWRTLTTANAKRLLA
ncbi:amidohydrolase family protein [Mycobacterium sp. 852002-51057_SCH5723018]|uniref:amidohydrolase family protein n=1 Tax=Mycobacterium sp. 852002-51057_SCH5723018 TaxID=1834094 RepID=UPI0008008381|nr:amidohydrolase family protein [Mycobacterium sp. 852002-51057_SCH5723018]OBG28530.1 amidohydrolase [Mycobacterium sp. 852002-51057_SCH5723018]